ncbi:MAG: DUF354 domain-containing protein [Bacteroidetes bacterium]|nr:DUF354 domain-containing protein [Bacteroidota bacterium]
MKKVLIDINHPAYFHLFRNLAAELKKHGVEIIITASKKDITLDLLNKYNIPYINLGTYGESSMEKAFKVPVMAMRVLRVALKHKPDLMVGAASSRIAHAGVLTGIPSFVYTDTDHAKLEIMLFKPFATRIYTPDCFLKDLGRRQVRHASYKELFYLHPNRFTPNFEPLKAFGINEGEKFFIVRFVSWNAIHDIGHKGFTADGKLKLVKMLLPHGKVIISSEGHLPAELQKHTLKIPIEHMHHFLHFAEICIGESPTMASEAAVLGTPSVIVCPLQLCYLEELNRKYNMVFQYKDENDALAKISNLVITPGIKNEWELKRKKLLQDKIDGTSYLAAEILRFLQDNSKN